MAIAEEESEPAMEKEMTRVDAEEVFVLMKKNTRVSRNIRACWFFRHLKTTIPFAPMQELHLESLTQDLTLAALVPEDGEPMLDASQTYSVGIHPNTTVTFLASRYRMAFTLDLSPSVVSVDVVRGQLVSEAVFQNFCNCLKGLVKPFHLSGSHLMFSPQLFITVIAHTPIVCSAANQVLIQGVGVSQDNVDRILAHAREQLRSLEHQLSMTFTRLLKGLNDKGADTLLTEEGEGEAEEEDCQASLLKMTEENLRLHELAFVDMVRCGILALQMLPENSSSGIVVITDGAIGVPEANMLELLLTQLRNSTITCSFLNVGSALHIQRQLGHVPNFELMQFIATATFGGYFLSCPDVSEDESFAPNVYHQAMYYWSFQKGVEGFSYDGSQDDPDVIGSPSWVHRHLYSHPLHGNSFGLELLRKKHQECTVQAGLSSVLSVRLREGYTIKDVRFLKGGSEIEVKLILPWRDNGKIEYNARAAWPLEKNKVPTRVEIYVEGSYDFLHELTCSSIRKIPSPYRTAHIKKFWQLLQNISQTDRLLVHLQSFGCNRINYEVPEYIRSGIPLFVLDPINPNNPDINSQLSSEESQLSQFASFWKPVIMLDTNIWQKWVHSHRIGLVLEQDLPLPRYLHVPNSSGRYNILQCRQALASLTQLLKHWATFVLAENHSYIKFMPRGGDKPPSFFCLLRVTSKPPYVILRLAFLGGTPSYIRRQEIQALKLELAQLRFPQRYTQKTDKKPALKVAAESTKEAERKAPLLREWSEINCCTVLRKPVEKILIRYEQKPEDLFVVEDRSRPFHNEGGGGAGQEMLVKQSVNSKFNTLSHYLVHHRWIWSVQLASSVPLSLNTVGKMLHTLTKIRLQEGFHFASSNSGISNMILEVDMVDNQFTKSSGAQAEEFDDEQQTCVMQYIVFPPHTKTSRDSVSEDDMDEMETTEADGEVQIVTECWVEPQFGICINNTPERLHFEKLTHMELAQAFFDVDYECISSLTTFNHLIYLCQNVDKTPSLGTDVAQSGGSSPPSTPGRRRAVSQGEDDERQAESTVSFIAFPFDLVTLLPRSQQAELLFSTFVVGTGKTSEQEAGADPKGSNEVLFTLLFEKLRAIHDREHFLTSDVATMYLQQLCGRSRDLNQHPFPFQRKASPTCTHADSCEASDGGVTTDGGVDKSHQPTPDGTMSSSNSFCSNRYCSSGTPFGASRTPHGLQNNARSHNPSKNTTRSPDHSPSGNGNGRFGQNGSFHGQPMWKCYLKAVSANHLLLTFIPASYDDLLLLNEQEEEKDSRTSGTEEKKQTGDSDSILSPRTHTTVIGKDTACDAEMVSGKAGARASALPVYDDTDSCHTGHTSAGGRRGSAALSGAENVSATVITVTEPSPCQSPDCTVTHSREDDVKEWVNTSCSAAVPPAKGSMIIPIYVYDCHLHSVTESVINRWTFSLPPDLHEDLTFSVESEDNQPSPGHRGRLASFDREASVVEEKEENEFPRSGWRASLDRKSMDSIGEGARDFKEHCHVITEAYFSCFVTGLYQSLRHNYFVDHRDMDAAICRICQESLPLEVDMTAFLHATCGHLQKLVTQARKEVTATKELDHAHKLSVRFLEVVDIQSDDGEELVIPEILQFPRRMVPMMPSLWNEDCEHSPGVHKILQDKFMSIVHHWFQPVASMPDYFFYSPESLQRSSRCEDYNETDRRDSTDEKTDENAAETDASVKEEEDGDMMVADFGHHGNAAEVRDRDHSAHVSMDSNLDVSLSDLDINATHDHDLEQEVVPLFIHFTCTLKRRTEHHNSSVTHIPQCLGDLLVTMKDPLLAIDFGEFRITFDINCLTLPNESDLDLSPAKKAGLLRSFSNQSQGSGSRHSECENDDAQSGSASSEFAFGDPLDHLPNAQHEAVMTFKTEVEWLLRDEVASSLRHMYPINADALDFVISHVRLSYQQKYPSVAHKMVNLQFVYGADRSLKPFIEEFERMSLPGYHLTKVHKYYILTVDRAHASNILHAQALNNALAELSHNGDPNPVGADANKLFPAMEERSYSLPNIMPTSSILPSGEAPPPSALSTQGAGPAGLGRGADNRPRSGSDAKFSKEKMAENMRMRQMNVQSMLAEKEGMGEASDASLRKSHSFAGLQDQVTSAPATSTASPEVNTGCLSAIKASPSSLFGNRSRHFSAPSGQGTPLSRASTLPQTPSMGSSHGSGTSEAGFEGDVSDENMDDTASVSDPGMAFPRLPNFWLIKTVQADCVELFFHTRNDADKPASQQQPERALVTHAVQCIQDICCKINKQLLLKELLETQMCNVLLVPEADEDVRWTDRRTVSGRYLTDAFEGEDDDEKEEGQGRGYLAANMNLEPGHFACDCVWRKLFFLHPRLNTGTQRQGISRGLTSLRGVLNKFSVGNRKNMFVIKETSSSNVFYLKLKEMSTSGLNDPMEIQADLESSMSEMSLSSQFQTLRTVESKADMETRSEGDTMSLASGYSFSRMSSRMDDMIELTVHGIEEPGKDIREDLMKVMQNKLDDTVMEVISVMLARNPQCKLRPEDVQFIQTPEQDPTEIMQLTVPSHAMLYLSALLYYLRQNLLQFLHTPNFQEDSPDFHFHDFIDGRWQAIPNDQVYLYIIPQAGGRKGMACVNCSLVDGCGNSVRLLSCPSPSRLATTNNLPSMEELSRMVETSVHHPATSGWGPGPTALIQFRIWQRGSLDMKQLKDRLVNAVGHALCDIITEFMLLTAPICSTPRNLQDMKALHVTSLPSSPVTVKLTFIQLAHEEPECKPSLSRKMSDSSRIGLKPIPQSASPFQTLRETFTSSRSKLTSPSEVSQSFDWSQVQNLTAPASAHVQVSTPPKGLQLELESPELQELLSHYDRGDMGSLHPVFASAIQPWFQFCHKRGMPTISKVEMSLRADYSVEYILKELQNALPTIGAKAPLKVFKVLHYATLQSTPFSVPFYPCKPQPSSLEKQLETAMDSVQAEVGSIRYVVVARDAELWKMTVPMEFSDYQQTLAPPSQAELKAYQNGQKFVAKSVEPPKEKEGLESLPMMNQSFIPRQKILVMFAFNKKLVVYMYNFASDLASGVDRTVKRVVNWHNARAFVLTSVLSQKMGLFRHRPFAGLPSTQAQEENPYTQSSNDIDNLIKFSAPPHEANRRHSSLTVQSRSISRFLNQFRPFDDTYKNLKPSKPMPQTVTGSLRDHVSRHGMQAQEIRTRYRREAERMMKLQQLYLNWLQKTSGNLPVTEDYLDLMKQSSRLFHYCATPLLFSQQWRQCVLDQNLSAAAKTPVVPTPPPPTPEREPITTKSRSRHSSGASVSSQRTRQVESQEAARAKRTSDPSPAPSAPGATSSPPTPSRFSVGPPRTPDDPWHREMCHNFLMQYRSYLMSEFGFICINLQPSMHKRSGREDNRQRYMTVDLQKTLTSGIILMELSLRGKHFVLKMFVLDYLQLGISNHDMQLLFVDECEKYKDLIHVHSFAHDFHLRCIHDYIKGTNSSLPPDFHLSNFLQDFLNVYPIPPSFARNCLAQESIVIRDLPCPGPQLFDYMRNQIRQFDMNVFAMSLSDISEPDFYWVKKEEYALVQIREAERLVTDGERLGIPGVGVEEDVDGYTLSLIITKDASYQLASLESDSQLLKLKFFAVLNCVRDVHPKRTLEKKFGEFLPGAAQQQSDGSDSGSMGMGESDLELPIAVKQHLGVRQELIDYLGYSNLHQTRLFNLLNAQVKAGREKIEEMVKMSKVKCRRDYLWERMSVSVSVKDEGKKKGKQVEETLDQSMTPLSPAEFEELLSLVSKQPLSEIDPRLTLLSNMPPAWYSSLMPVLSSRFSNACRYFDSTSPHRHHTVILNSKWMDMFILVSVDQHTGCKMLSQVLRNACDGEEEEERRQVEQRMLAHHQGRGEAGEGEGPGEGEKAVAAITEHKYSLVEDFVNVCCFHLWASVL